MIIGVQPEMKKEMGKKLEEVMCIAPWTKLNLRSVV